MSSPILNAKTLPFCKGCGHDLIAKNVAKGIEKAGFAPLDIVLVTDIGCHGMIDGSFNTHTVHGIHGRSVALGAGVSLALAGSHKKVIAFIGDGGATIGLQHIIEAARMNIDMTIVIHNNMLYGMTGGQTSGLTPTGFRTTTARDGNPFAAHDICALTHIAGAAFSSRILGLGDYSDRLAEALLVKGCSVVEIMELCPSYGVKLNPKRKLSEIMESMGRREGAWRNDRPGFLYTGSPSSSDLTGKLPVVLMKHKGDLRSRYSIIITGSAGEGVQVAGSVLSRAALSSGYHVTQKGIYPVTVGVGFSTTEINIAPFKINYNGIQNPDAILVTSRDGLRHNLKRINRMKSGLLFIDSSLEMPETGADVTVRDFRAAGVRIAAFYSILSLVSATGIITFDAISEAITGLGLDDQVPFRRLVQMLNN